MNKPLITICTVNYNSSDFIGLMLYAFNKLTSNSYKVVIRDNNSTVEDYNNLKKIIEKYDNVLLYREEENSRGSVAHGKALNDLVSRIDTDYGVIVDADATFLIKNWDGILLEKINEDTPIYGTQADMAGGKPKDFPLMFALMFKTQILKDLKIDFRPKDISLFQDTGWEIREKYKAAGYQGGLIYDFNTRDYKKGPFSNIVCSEYYLDKEAKGGIFAAHFGRGSAPKAKKLISIRNRSSIFVKIINKFLSYANIIKWRKDKKLWITKAYKIINNQNV